MLPNIKSILYCTQIGPNSPYIFRHALGLAEATGATINILNVMETLSPRQEALVEGYVGKGTLHGVVEGEEKNAAERLRLRIEAVCAREGGQECFSRIGKVFVAEGHPAEQILHHVRQTDADLVVMGANAETSLLDAVMGSTADKIIRHCPVPVLTVQVPEDLQEPGVSDI